MQVYILFQFFINCLFTCNHSFCTDFKTYNSSTHNGLFKFWPVNCATYDYRCDFWWIYRCWTQQKMQWKNRWKSIQLCSIACAWNSNIQYYKKSYMTTVWQIPFLSFYNSHPLLAYGLWNRILRIKWNPTISRNIFYKFFQEFISLKKHFRRSVFLWFRHLKSNPWLSWHHFRALPTLAECTIYFYSSFTKTLRSQKRYTLN